MFSIGLLTLNQLFCIPDTTETPRGIVYASYMAYPPTSYMPFGPLRGVGPHERDRVGLDFPHFLSQL